jgi:hypothetical protein
LFPRRRAADAAKKDFSTIWRERKADPEFAKAEAEALKASGPVLEDEAVRRAMHGLVRFKFTKGGEPLLHPTTGEPYYELEYSDTLLALLLKGRVPERYRDKIEHSGEVEHTHKHMTLEEFRQRMKEARV